LIRSQGAPRATRPPGSGRSIRTAICFPATAVHSERNASAEARSTNTPHTHREPSLSTSESTTANRNRFRRSAGFRDFGRGRGTRHHLSRGSEGEEARGRSAGASVPLPWTPADRPRGWRKRQRSRRTPATAEHRTVARAIARDRGRERERHLIGIRLRRRHQREPAPIDRPLLPDGERTHARREAEREQSPRRIGHLARLPAAERRGSHAERSSSRALTHPARLTRRPQSAAERLSERFRIVSHGRARLRQQTRASAAGRPAHEQNGSQRSASRNRHPRQISGWTADAAQTISGSEGAAAGVHRSQPADPTARQGTDA